MATFALWIMWFDKGNQASPGHNLIHLDQEAFTADLFAFISVLGIGDVHLLHRGSTVQCLGLAYLTRLKNFFRVDLADDRRDDFSDSGWPST
ncbi:MULTISPECIES: hypothetical protein [Pseudomonas]|uniref:hypothetical protein n=1 Tax=Pseudomonas TaxID=286 RepID=UPI002115BEAD|nr:MULTISPECIES: hypothetical protein [unclassified Pseudomonas]MCV2228096.1 hypothetical protein [Pseudomonas sp. AU10]